MAIVDEQGRVFGRINLVDAALIALLCGAIPLAYGAYALFRTPAPRLTAIVPTVLPYGANVQVQIKGDNLRPYMRVSFNEKQGVNFLFGSTAAAEVQPPTLPPGTYDVVLYDYAQEQSRLKKALTILPPPLPNTAVELVGVLTNLPEAVAKSVAVGMKVQGNDALAVGKPQPVSTSVNVGVGNVDIPVEGVLQVPIAFRMSCAVQMLESKPICLGAGIGAPLRAGTFVTLQTSLGDWPFQIHQVRSPSPLETVEAQVRLVGHAIVLQQIKAGDIDAGMNLNELAAGARVVAVQPVRHLNDASGEERAAVDVTLRLAAQRDASGFWYAGDGLRAGGDFVLRTRDYEAHGSVVRLVPTKSTGESK